MCRERENVCVRACACLCVCVCACLCVCARVCVCVCVWLAQVQLLYRAHRAGRLCPRFIVVRWMAWDTELQKVCWVSPWSKVLLEKLVVSQLAKKFTKFYGNRKFIAVFTTAHHLSLSWSTLLKLMHCQFVTLKFHSNIITYAYTLQPVAILFRFPPKYPHSFHFSPVRATCPAHLILLDMITLIISSLCSYHHSPVTFSLFGSNIFLGTVFSGKLFLHERDRPILVILVTDHLNAQILVLE